MITKYPKLVNRELKIFVAKIYFLKVVVERIVSKNNCPIAER